MSMTPEVHETAATAAEVQLLNVCKTLGGRTIIDNLSLSVGRNELVVILGPSGCGKTTLLRMIAGLEPLDAGEIWIEGRRVDRLAPGERRIAMVFQHYALYPHMTVRENMSFGLHNVRMPRDEIARRVEQAAKMLEIERHLDRLPGQISGGERQRVAIGRAIVKQPKLFLFDEPLSSLDAALRIRTRLELAGLHRRLGSAMLLVTHDQVEAMTLANRIVVMSHRGVEQIGTPLEVYSLPATEFVAGFVGASQMNFAPARVMPTAGGFAAATLADGTTIATTIRMSSLPADASFKFAIRAEAIRVGTTEQCDTRGVASCVERLGDRTFIHMQLENELTLVATDIGSSRVDVGDTVGLQFDGSAAHLFAQGRGYHAEHA